MVFAPLRCPKLFCFPFALLVGCSFRLFCSSLYPFDFAFFAHVTPGRCPTERAVEI